MNTSSTIDLPRMLAFAWSGLGSIRRAGVLASLGVGNIISQKCSYWASLLADCIRSTWWLH